MAFKANIFLIKNLNRKISQALTALSKAQTKRSKYKTSPMKLR